MGVWTPAQMNMYTSLQFFGSLALHLVRLIACDHDEGLRLLFGKHLGKGGGRSILGEDTVGSQWVESRGGTAASFDWGVEGRSTTSDRNLNRWEDHQIGEGWPGTWWSPGFRMALPLRSSCHVHACRLRYAGDRLLPCKERLQRLDEESCQRLLRDIGLVESWLGFCLWRTEWQRLHRNRRFLWHRFLHSRC